MPSGHMIDESRHINKEKQKKLWTLSALLSQCFEDAASSFWPLAFEGPEKKLFKEERKALVLNNPSHSFELQIFPSETPIVHNRETYSKEKKGST